MLVSLSPFSNFVKLIETPDVGTHGERYVVGSFSRGDVEERQRFTIFRVPAYIRESNRSAYEPRMVSIGPYYHDAAALRLMEDHKWRFLTTSCLATATSARPS